MRLEPLPAAGASRVIPLAAKTWLVVANVPLKAFGQDALNKLLQDVDWMSRCGVAHQAVIESLLDSDAVVPMTLFTIFANDARAVAEAKKDAARMTPASIASPVASNGSSVCCAATLRRLPQA